MLDLCDQKLKEVRVNVHADGFWMGAILDTASFLEEEDHVQQLLEDNGSGLQ
jgi:hypothetical protein